MSKVKKRESKPIGDVLAAILRTGIKFTEDQLKKRVRNPYLLDGVSLAFPFSTQVVNILNDENPENNAQVRELLLDHVNGPIAEFLDRILTEKISAVDEDNLRKILFFLKEKGIDALEILSDDDIENNKQLKAFWDALLESKEFHDLVKFSIIVPFLAKRNVKEDVITFVLEVIDLAIAGFNKTSVKEKVDLIK
jgi:hypothetical protein